MFEIRLHVDTQCKFYGNHCGVYSHNGDFPSTNPAQQSNNTNNLNCDGLVNGNSGCGITDWSRASYGPYFDAQGGGVFAMKWDEIDISVCMYYLSSLEADRLLTSCDCQGSFYRAAIPPDITQGSPNPANWGVPSAVLQSNNCDLLSFFKNHSIVFGKIVSHLSFGFFADYNYQI